MQLIEPLPGPKISDVGALKIMPKIHRRVPDGSIHPSIQGSSMWCMAGRGVQGSGLRGGGSPRWWWWCRPGLAAELPASGRHSPGERPPLGRQKNADVSGATAAAVLPEPRCPSPGPVAGGAAVRSEGEGTSRGVHIIIRAHFFFSSFFGGLLICWARILSVVFTSVCDI